MHNVVFEYLPSAGGFAGVRTWTCFGSKAEFHPKKLDPREKVLAEGVSEDEAIRMTSLTPEICRITAAIEQSDIAEDGTIDGFLLDQHLTTSSYAITHDRQCVRDGQLTRITDYEKVVVGEEETEKNRLIRIALKYSSQPYGQVNLDLLLEHLNAEVVIILSARLINDLRKFGHLLFIYVDDNPESE